MPHSASGDCIAMADLRNPRLIYLKGGLFLFLGVLASALLLAEHPSFRTAALLALAVWSFGRAYYFAFYVIEHYIDPGFRYRGVIAFARYLIRRTPASEIRDEPPDEP
jgi:hypothetical protein